MSEGSVLTGLEGAPPLQCLPFSSGQARAGMGSAKLTCVCSFLHPAPYGLWYVGSLPYLGISLQRPQDLLQASQSHG